MGSSVIFNRAFLKTQLTVGTGITVIGKFDKTKNVITASDIKMGTLMNKTRIEPVYHCTRGLTNKNLATYINMTLLMYGKEIEDYKNGPYAEYIKNPEEYEKKYKCTKKYIEFLKNEFPKKINWTDDQCYDDMKEDYDSDMIDKDGNLLSKYNPKSKWDWYEVGGRWCGGIPMKTNTKLEIKSCNECMVSQIDMDKISPPYAYVDTNGIWNERGEMGWFGISSNDKDEKSWDDEFKKFINNQNKSTIVTLVDCHI